MKLSDINKISSPRKKKVTSPRKKKVTSPGKKKVTSPRKKKVTSPKQKKKKVTSPRRNSKKGIRTMNMSTTDLVTAIGKLKKLGAAPPPPGAAPPPPGAAPPPPGAAPPPPGAPPPARGAPPPARGAPPPARGAPPPARGAPPPPGDSTGGAVKLPSYIDFTQNETVELTKKILTGTIDKDKGESGKIINKKPNTDPLKTTYEVKFSDGTVIQGLNSSQIKLPQVNNGFADLFGLGGRGSGGRGDPTSNALVTIVRRLLQTGNQGDTDLAFTLIARGASIPQDGRAPVPAVASPAPVSVTASPAPLRKDTIVTGVEYIKNNTGFKVITKPS